MSDVQDFTVWSSTAASNQPAGTTTVGTGLSGNLRQIQAEIAKWRDAIGYGILNGTSVAGTNSITASTGVAPTLASGQTYRIVPANSNTGAAFFNVNGSGNKSIFLNGAACIGYELRKNCPVDLYYDGTQFNITAGAHGDGTPIASETNRYFATAPNGHLLCDGSAVSRTIYADLFAVLSTTYGTGDGSTTFNVPNAARRVAVGSGGSGTSTLANTVGSTGGEETHLLTTAEMPSHSHALSDGQSPMSSAGGVAFGSTGGNMGITSIANAGGGGAHNNMQPSIVVYKCIKY